ncbi:hypothetical protein HN51_027676, partial [Arachis hypogaea]
MVFSLTKPPSNETKTKPKEKHLGSCPIHLNSPSTSPSPAPPPRFPHSVLLSFRSRATGSAMPSNKRLKVTASTTEKSSVAVPPSRSSAQPIPPSCSDLCPVLPARKDPHSSLPTPGDARPLTLVFESGVHHPLGSSSVLCHESINSDDDAESFDEHVATISCGSRKNNDYWKVNVI